jgi:hypothetical protein
MKTAFITNYQTVGFTFGIGTATNIELQPRQATRVLHITIGFMFWTYAINIKLKTL